MRIVPFLLILFIALPLPSSPPQAHSSGRTSLGVGSVTVWLGMPKDDVIKRLTDAGYRMIGLSGGTVFATLGNEEHLIGFKNDRLTYADVQWYIPGTGEAEAIFGALGALADKVQSQSCVVSRRATDSTPDTSMNSVRVSCGERSVMIAKGKFADKPNTLFVVETIGQR